MTPTVTGLNLIFATATLVGQVVLVILAIVAGIAYFRKEDFFRQIPFLRFVRKHVFPISFILVLVSVALTLIYSDVFGFVPCGLCWFQRIFLYPQLVILGIAWWRKDRHAGDYLIGLSLIGGAIALYQHWLQLGGTELIGCPVSAGDCAQRIVFEYGYITFPLMSFTVFAFLVLLGILMKKAPSNPLSDPLDAVKDLIR